MKAIVTGMNGTVAPYVYHELMRRDIEVYIWDRRKNSIDSEEAVFHYIESIQPDLFFHIATGPVEWVEHIAKATQELKIKLLYTSSVSVFSENGTGPYTAESIPDAEDDYGRYKIEGENAVSSGNPHAVIARLGWQIGSSSGSNNMFDFLVKAQNEKGFIEASSKWYPSCSFLEDTAQALVDAALDLPSGTYLLNSNTKYSFLEIVKHLRNQHGIEWDIRETTTFIRDDRMFDDRAEIRKLDFKPD
ncbi:sugar nucleotide-binding protein [Proteiniclasticum sp.]|uniref:sugar nucleotide-binding protein n=1 Tax=Proteiniclasticum sp. TaxID=2053595 RepID=UPI00289B737F|nr:sugar nucleotide-binding protein [Proteiniclasticum sp.]